MALLLRSVTSVAAKRATACALAEAAATSTSVRGFAVKKDKKKGKKKGGDDANFEQMLRAIKGQYPEADEWTEEEKQRHQEIGRRYNMMTSIEHNHFMRDVQTKIDLKWEAINALPAELQAEAMEIDLAPAPEERGMATWTPPIPGFRRYTDEGAETMD
ncbi:putative mitochondrial protein [Phytophthora cinnamomi]|uniref:putative mitochondrial protein n=1 Tax=Phytophthora cinnamomi TaxID=4785 RepID=UPI00355A18FB|nr:putative mitochondrial protein [Phytophthora cinnamomi]